MAELIYQGKITFSDLVPGLAEAAASVAARADEVNAFLQARQANVAALQKKAEAVQAEINRTQSAVSGAQSILNDAQNILEEAQNLVENLSDALSASGIYHYNYVGQISNMGGQVSSEFSAGLPDREGHPDDAVAAIILIVGSDGGTSATVQRIGRLFGQIGNNAASIISLYEAEVD